MDELIAFAGALTGTGVLCLNLCLWLLHTRVFPTPPRQLLDLAAQVDRATATGDYQGDTDLYVLDQAMIEAELRKRGSTLVLFLRHPLNRLATGIGTAAVPAVFSGWALGLFPSGLPTILGAIVGAALLLKPFLEWTQFRSRLRRR